MVGGPHQRRWLLLMLLIPHSRSSRRRHGGVLDDLENVVNGGAADMIEGLAEGGLIYGPQRAAVHGVDGHGLHGGVLHEVLVKVPHKDGERGHLHLVLQIGVLVKIELEVQVHDLLVDVADVGARLCERCDLIAQHLCAPVVYELESIRVHLDVVVASSFLELQEPAGSARLELVQKTVGELVPEDR